MKSLRITRAPVGVFGVNRILIFIFLFIGFKYYSQNEHKELYGLGHKNGLGLFVQGKETQKLSKLDRERATRHPETANLPRYPIPGMKYDDSDSSSVSEAEKSKKSRHKSKYSGSVVSKKSSKDDSGDTAEGGFKSDHTKKKKKKSSGKKKKEVGIQVDMEKEASVSKKYEKRKSKKSQTSSSPSHTLRSTETMSELLSFIPGVKDYIWQDPKERRTYRNLNPYHGKYFPKVATSPFRKSSECASLFSSAKDAYESREIRITPSQFVGLALPFARRLGDILGQFVTIQDSCLMLRILLHIYSGMRTRAQLVNIIGAVLQNDVILGRMEDRNGVINRVMDLTNYFLQLPRHRVDSKSKQMSAIEISSFFHLSVYPKDNSFESRLLPTYREKGKLLKERIEEKMGIVIARDEVMSMIYIILNLLEEERTVEQCSEIVSAVIGITHFEPLIPSQREELEKICAEVIGCSTRGPVIFRRESIIDVFGPGSAIVEMRQTDIEGPPISGKVRIWKEIGTLDYLGRVISVLFNDCNGLKANHLNRLCSMMEVMNQRLIKTGTVRDLITIEELCGAHRYRNKHPGIKWSIAIKATLQERHKNIPVKVESLFSHFIKHERQKLAPLDGTLKQKRELFYAIPEFPEPSYLETVTPKSPALGIPTREPHKHEVFYAFNTQPNWVQNRFILAAAFIEECLMRVGSFYHISAVSLYNELGGVLNADSDLSLFTQIPGVDSEQLKMLFKSYINFEFGLFHSETNEDFNLKEPSGSFLEAFYEYPYAKYVQGRYYIDVDINFEELVSGLSLKNYFYKFDKSPSTQRLFTFQAFINNRLNVHGFDGNMKFVTSEEANRILLGCVDGSKFALIAEMRKTLSSDYFSDSLIDVLSGEWIEYEEQVLPEVLELNIVSDGVTYTTLLYSQGFKLAVHGLEGWELLVDPQQTLGNLANNIKNTIFYVSKPLNVSPFEENRLDYIYHWIQLYFIYKLLVIPKFNKTEIRTIFESIPSTSYPTKSIIRDLILNTKSLILEGTLVEMLSMAFESYFFYEKHFLVARNVDLTQIFATPNYGILQGKLFVPRTVWSFLPSFDNVIGNEISNASINLAELALAFINRMFFIGESEQRVLIDLVNWAVAPDLENQKIFFSLGLNGSYFVQYVKDNTWLKNIRVFMLIPWVDHLASGFQFRRRRGLISGPISRPSEDIPGVPITGDQQNDQRAKEIISEIERLNFEYRNLLLEFGGQAISDESAKNLLHNIESTIQTLLTELSSISSGSMGAALLMITEKKLLPPYIFQLTGDELQSIGVVSINEAGDVVLDSSKYKITEGIFSPALDIGTLDSSNGSIKPYGSSNGVTIPTQIINRLQAFRVWWNSVFPKISFVNKDPLLLMDFQSVSKLVGIFNTFGYSEDPLVLGVLLWDITGKHPTRMKDSVFTIVAETFINDERNALRSLSPSVPTLEEAYRGTRIIARFQEVGGTPPQFALINHLNFIPLIPATKPGAAERDKGGEIIHDRVHFLEYLERVVAEYYASSPRKMPTIGIPRMNNLAINFSIDLNEMALLISNIFGEGSPYISAPSLGASAPSLANFIIENIPKTDLVDDTYITLHFEEDYIYYGSPIMDISDISDRKYKAEAYEVNFGWTVLHSIVKENDLFQTGLLRFGDLVEFALKYASEKVGLDINYEAKDLYNFSFSYAIGQHFLESARVNFFSIFKASDKIRKNRFYAIFAKSISILITNLSELPISTQYVSTAHSLFSVVIADSLAGGFFPESVRNEMIQRWSFVFSLNSEFAYTYVADSREYLYSVSPDVPIFYTSSSFSVAQRQHNQISDLKTLNGNLYITRTSACNILLSAGLFIGKVIESPQNSGRFNSLTPDFLTEHFTWSGYCGISGFYQDYFRPLIISIFSNLPGFATLTVSEKNDLDLILDLFETKIVEIISSYYDEYNSETPVDVIFGNMDICNLAIISFFEKNVVNIEDLKPGNFEPLKLSYYPNHRHSGLNTLEENSLCRISKKGVFEEISLSISPGNRVSVISSGYYQRDPNRQLRKHDSYFLSQPLSDTEAVSNFPLETLSKLAEKYSSKIKITTPALTTICRGDVCSYVKLGDSDDQDSEVKKFVERVSDSYRYVLPGNYLNGKLVKAVNRAVFFLYWWLYTWDKLRFYSSDFFLGSLFSSIEFLSDVFDQAQLSTEVNALFKVFYNRIVDKFKGYSRTDHLRVILVGFLDSENKAIEFTGDTNVYEAYSALGMMNAVHAIYLNFKVPNIPIPSGKLTYNNLDDVSSNNLSQYLFRVISEYFAAGPRFYPTTLIPSTSFLSSHFTLEKKDLTYLLYVWSNLESLNSIRAFFEAPSIGASFESLAEYIIEETQLKLFNRFVDVNDFLSSENFFRFFKYGNPLSKIVNLELLDFTCIPGSSNLEVNSVDSVPEPCRPFAFKLDDQSKTNVLSIVEKSFVLAMRDSGIPSDSVISTHFSSNEVVSAVIKGINILDAVRVHGISKYKAKDLYYLQFNKFCLVFSKHFSRILADFTGSYFLPRNKYLFNLPFNDLKQLSGRSLNALYNVASELDNLRAVSTEQFNEFLGKFDNDVVHCSIWYESFFGIVVLDQARGLIGIPDVIRKQIGDFLYLQVPTFNYVYSFVLFFISVLINKNSRKLNLSFPYMNLLSLENIVRVADYNSRGEALPNSLFRVISTTNKYSFGDLSIQKINVIYNLFVDNARKSFGSQVYVAFSSRTNLGKFLSSLFHVSKSIDFKDPSYVGVSHQEEDLVKEVKYSVIGPKTQSLSNTRIENELLNDNELRQELLKLYPEYNGVITGSFQKPWVSGFLSVNEDELVHVPHDHLSHLDQGNVFLQRRILPAYNLRSNSFLFREDMNSAIELGTEATFSSGLIENSVFTELNGVEVGILNRAVLFREWLIRFWGLSKRLYRDPIILSIINSFSGILEIFRMVRYNGVGSLAIDLHSFVYDLVKLSNREVVLDIAEAFCRFENELLIKTGYFSIRELHNTGTSVDLLDNVSIYRVNDIPKICEIKKEVWPTSPLDSQAKKNVMEYLTLKLKNYLSERPRSAITFTIPDVSILLDNFSSFKYFTCVIEAWARDRPDLISAPFIGLDPENIHKYILGVFDQANYIDYEKFSESRLSYGLLDDSSYFENLKVSFNNEDISLRQYDSLYIEMISPFLDTPNFKFAVDLLRSLMIIVLDVNQVNLYELFGKSSDGDKFKSAMERINRNLDFKTFLIRILLGIDQFIAAKMLVSGLRFLTKRKLNKVSFDFVKRLDALKECILYDSFTAEFDDIVSRVTMSLRKMGVHLTSGEILSLSSNHFFVSHINIFSSENLVLDCLNLRKFHKRPLIFNTIPELGLTSQLDGTLIDSYFGFSSNLIYESYVVDINGLLFMLLSLNSIINHNLNKAILDIPASINFATPGILTRISHCGIKTTESLSCISDTILNSLLELSIDVGDLSNDVLVRILEKVFSVLGELSRGSWPKYDSNITSLDLFSNNKGLIDSPMEFNPSSLNELLGDHSNLKDIVSRQFGLFPLLVCDISTSLSHKCKRFGSLIERKIQSLDYTLLYSLEAYKRGTALNYNPISYSDFLSSLGMSTKEQGAINPLLDFLGEAKNGYFTSKENKLLRIPVHIANRAALFYMFANVSTRPYVSLIQITLDECIQFFSNVPHMDISESTKFITRYFKNLEFYKAFQLLDAFYTVEKVLFSLHDRAPELEYENSRDLIAALNQLGPTPLDLEIPHDPQKNTHYYGKFLCQLAKRFFISGTVIETSPGIQKEISESTCETIAKHIWPNTESGVSPYIKTLVILEFLPSVRATPRLAAEFVSLHDWFVLTRIYDSFEGDIVDISRVFEIAFSRPFVCTSKELPWVFPNHSFNGIAFHEFNFISFIKASWIEFSKTYGLNAAVPSEGQLIKILESYYRNLPLSHSGVFDKLLSEARSKSGVPEYNIKNNPTLQLTEADEILLREGFFETIQRFWRVRHSGVMEVSFRWPYIACDSNNNPFVPGLSFPLAVNSEKKGAHAELEVTQLGEILHLP
ncbi:hypothetical protein FG386_003701 [Cryptosporidium ryanae]|uniref:uncharacterized protein n=1 Tax=Cryptosporidium ryanae TaxID=515981 RepID=UPI00351A1247|nr:hypothetical protein FG386_003701 [Cryptosporidium ryanae]